MGSAARGTRSAQAVSILCALVERLDEATFGCIVGSARPTNFAFAGWRNCTMNVNARETTTQSTNGPRSRLWTSQRFRYAASLVMEHLFLGLALACLIPPPRSVEGETFPTWYYSLILMWLFLLVSRVCALRRGDESWLGIALKLLVFSVFGLVLNSASRMW